MIVIISGTNRPESRTRCIADELANIYRSLSVPTQLLDLAELPAEIFQPSAYETKPPSFARFSEAVLESAGLVVVSPEYNGGPPGVLKYFIDMLEFPESFEARPVSFVGLAAGSWGALRPVEQLQQIFGYRNAHIFPKRVFLPGVYELLDDNGKLSDDDVQGRLTRQAEGFVSFIESLKGISLRG